MTLTVHPVPGLPEVLPGDDLAGLIADALAAAGLVLADGDVLVVAQKVVSKAEGALVPVPAGEDPTAARRRIALATARRVLVAAPVAVVETAHGFVCANAGLDASNAPAGHLVALPVDPDASARQLCAALHVRTGARVAVIVSDTFGRPWRLGQTDVAIGAAGIAALRDERGEADRDGRTLEVTTAAVADEVAGAADLVRRKGDGSAVVLVRGLVHDPDETTAGAAALVRPAEQDLFRRGRGALADALAGGVPGRAPGTPAAGHPAVDSSEGAAGAATVGPSRTTIGGADLDRVLAAARRVGGPLVDLVVVLPATAAASLRVAVVPRVPASSSAAGTASADVGAAPEDSSSTPADAVVASADVDAAPGDGLDGTVAAGAAAGALLATLVDLECPARLRAPRPDEPGVAVVEITAS